MTGDVWHNSYLPHSICKHNNWDKFRARKEYRFQYTILFPSQSLWCTSTTVKTLLSPVRAFLGQHFLELPECDLLAWYLCAVRELLVTEGEDHRGEVAGAAPGSGAAKRWPARLRRFRLAPAHTEPATQDSHYFQVAELSVKRSTRSQVSCRDSKFDESMWRTLSPPSLSERRAPRTSTADGSPSATCRY